MTLHVFFVATLSIFYYVLSQDVFIPDVLSDTFYKGESFPKKYLDPEELVPTSEDITSYLVGIKKLVDAMAIEPNKTDPSQSLGLYYTRVILKRTLKENRPKIRDDHHKSIKGILEQIENIMSHFHYQLKNENITYVLKRVAEVYVDDSAQVQSIANYNSHRIKDIILSIVEINEFAQVMDEATLPKEKYAELVDEIRFDNYTINKDDSDYCLGEIMYNPIPTTEIPRPCKDPAGCAGVLYDQPSVAYSLSHRLLNLMWPRQARRCYMKSPEEDDYLMDVLCSWMYRETVYLARRGYFYRDLFMEHGYKEFHRRHWYQKVISWIGDDGCMKENQNFEYNRTAVRIRRAKSAEEVRTIREVGVKIKNSQCHFHQMVLGAIMLAHGVRYSVEFGENPNLSSSDQFVTENQPKA